MSDEVNKTERKLRRTGDKQTLQGIVGDTDADDLDVFGYEIVYTTGEFTIDREALLEKCDELGFPAWMPPSQARANNAFTYAVKDLLEGREEVFWPEEPTPDNVEGEDYNRVRFDLKRNGSNYSWTVGAEMYIPEHQTTTDSGEWKAIENEDGQQGLGVIEYENPDGDGDPYVHFIDYVGTEAHLAPIWHAEHGSQPLQGGLKQRMKALYRKHWQEWNRGKDINNMVYYLVDQWTDSLKLRDACYFVPATHQYEIKETEQFVFDADVDPQEAIRELLADVDDASGWFTIEGEAENDGRLEVQAEVGKLRPIEDLIDAFQALYEWVDENADKPEHAQDSHLDVIEMMDTDRQKKMIERKASKKVRGMAEGMVEDVLDLFENDADLEETIASEVSNTMADLRATAGEYDGLLDGGYKEDLKTQNAVRRAVREALDDLDDAEAELVEAALAEVDEAPAPEAAA